MNGRDRTRVDPLRAGFVQSVSLVAQRRKVARAVDQTEDEDLLGGDLIDSVGDSRGRSLG